MPRSTRSCACGARATAVASACATRCRRVWWERVVEIIIGRPRSASTVAAGISAAITAVVSAAVRHAAARTDGTAIDI